MATFLLNNITCDTSAIESNGSRWHGRIAFTCGGFSATGTWIGYDRSEDGQLVDIEGASEVFCERLDDLKEQIESKISAALGLPHDTDPTGLWSALDAVVQARAVA